MYFTEKDLEEAFLKANNGVEIPMKSKEILAHFVADYMSKYLREENTAPVVKEYKEKMRKELQDASLVDSLAAKIIQTIQVRRDAIG